MTDKDFMIEVRKHFPKARKHAGRRYAQQGQVHIEHYNDFDYTSAGWYVTTEGIQAHSLSLPRAINALYRRLLGAEDHMAKARCALANRMSP